MCVCVHEGEKSGKIDFAVNLIISDEKDVFSDNSNKLFLDEICFIKIE